MDDACERRLRAMGSSSIVGADIRAALGEIDKLRAERERRNKEDPVTRLHNLCDGLAEHRHESPYSAEAWKEQDDAYREKCVELAASRQECDALRARSENLERAGLTLATAIINFSHGTASAQNVDDAVFNMRKALASPCTEGAKEST